MLVVEKLKRIYWKTRAEYFVWEMHFFSLIPGSLGMAVRQKYFAKILGSCGKPIFVAQNVKITSPEKLHLGNYVGIGIGAYITAGGGITIGNYVGIGPDAKIWSVNHIYKDPDQPWRFQGSEKKEVVIEDDVWIAASCIIKPGVTIGKGAIISAGSVLSKSIPPFAIVAGNPARVVGWRREPQKNS